MRHFIFFLLISFAVLPGHAGTPKDTLVVAWDMDELFTLDPAESFEFASNELIYNMYQGLLTHDPKNKEKFVGRVAESWSVDQDGKRHIFKIKKGLKFASGNPVTAHDVAFSLQRLIHLNKSAAGAFTQFGPSWTTNTIGKMVKAVSDDELHIYIEMPLAPTLVYNMLTSVAASVIDKKLVLEKSPDDYGHKWLRSHSAGSGPYQLKKWTPQQLVLLSRNRHYSPLPSLDKLMFRNVREPSTQELLLRKGDIDVAKNLSLNVIESIPGVSSLPLETANIKVLHLNQKNQYLKNPKVREALRYLIDYDGIAQNIDKGTLMVHNSFVPAHFQFSITGKQFDYNVEKAKKLLIEAGYPNGFTVILSSVSPEIPQKLKHDFVAAGINVEIHLGDSKQVLTKVRGRTHDMAIATWGSDFYDPDANASTFLRNIDNSDASTEKTLAWRNAWDIPTLTEETNMAKQLQNVDERAKKYKELQDIFLKDAPMIVMFQMTKILAIQDTVVGLDTRPSMSTILYEHAHKT